MERAPDAGDGGWRFSRTLAVSRWMTPAPSDEDSPQEVPVAWFRRRSASGSRPERAVEKADFAHLEAFISSRRGVEAFLEPKTTVTQTTVLLIAHDGEWTRRRVPSVEAARSFTHRMGIPVYDVGLVGYPQRMRDFNERRKRAEGTSTG